MEINRLCQYKEEELKPEINILENKIRPIIPVVIAIVNKLPSKPELA